NVDIGRVVQSDETFDLKTEPQVVVAALFVLGQLADELPLAERAVLINTLGEAPFPLEHNRHIAIVAVLVKADAAPIARRRLVGRTIAVRVGLRSSEEIEPGPDRIVSQ